MKIMLTGSPAFFLPRPLPFFTRQLFPLSPLVESLAQAKRFVVRKPLSGVKFSILLYQALALMLVFYICIGSFLFCCQKYCFSLRMFKYLNKR